MNPNGWLGYSDYEAQKYIPALDGLRALAIALMIVDHLHDRVWTFLTGSVGVTIFFVLSGYLITRLGLQEERCAGRVNVSSFYLRRAFRILPLYYLVLVAYAVLILGAELWPTKILPFRAVLPYDLGFFQEIPHWKIPAAVPFLQSWSMGVEEKFYILWPLLMAGIPRTRQNTRLAIVAIGAAIFMIQGTATAGRPIYNMGSYGFILLGVALALLLSRPRLYRAFIRAARFGAPVALVIAIMTQLPIRAQTQLTSLTAIYALAVTILIGAIVTHQGVVTRMLSMSRLRGIGRVSYGIYMIHILCLDAVEQIIKPEHSMFSGFCVYVATLAMSTAVAYILHRLIERPMIIFGRHISEKFRPAPLQIEVATAH